MYRLYWRDRELGTISGVVGDFPWMYGDFTPTAVDPAFREFFEFMSDEDAGEPSFDEVGSIPRPRTAQGPACEGVKASIATLQGVPRACQVARNRLSTEQVATPVAARISETPNGRG